jgi:general secretion pathway protein B
MSYILDALKKSDEERRREQGPTLQTVYRRRPQSQRSSWPLIVMTAVLVMLAAGVGVYLGYLGLWQQTEQLPKAPLTANQPHFAGQTPLDESRAGEQATALTSQTAPKKPLAPISESLTVLPYAQLPDQARNALPAMAFSFHVYSDNPARRTIIINGRRVKEGAEVEAGLRLLEITQSGVIFSWRGYAFSIDVVEAW